MRLRIGGISDDRTFTYVLVACMAGACLCSCKRSETVVWSTSYETLSAKIIAYNSGFVFSSYDADLVIADSNGILMRTNLIVNRDSVEDVRIEFKSLAIVDGAVQVNAEGQHYSGARIFPIPKRNEKR